MEFSVLLIYGIFAIITLASILWILAPIFAGDTPTREPLVGGSADTNDRTLRRNQQLADLVADQELGKLDPDDFSRMKGELDAD
jgi:hypothetical protein